MRGRDIIFDKTWLIEKEDRKLVCTTLIAIGFGLLFLLGLLASWQAGPRREETWQALLEAGEKEATAGRLWQARGYLIGAHRGAVQVQSVEGLIRVGDAFARHDWVTYGGLPVVKIYLHALHLARYQGSGEGLLQVAERLSRIGQTSLAEVASRAAQDLGVKQTAALQGAAEAGAPEDYRPLTLVGSSWEM